MVRSPFIDKDGLTKGAWSPEEDEKLRTYIQRYGHWNWRELPKFAGLSRCGKSCRLRWLNYLRPDVRHGNFSKQEEDLIIELHKELGNKWSVIAAKLPGRTDNEIKNHWHAHLKKQVKHEDLQQSSNELCGGSDQNGELEAEATITNDTPTHPILESSLLSPEAYLSEFSCPSTSGSSLVSPSGINCLDSVSSAFEVSSGDFWTEPFIADDYTYNQDGYQSSSIQGELVLPDGSYFDDGMDLIYQVMQELPSYNSDIQNI